MHITSKVAMVLKKILENGVASATSVENERNVESVLVLPASSPLCATLETG